MNKSVFKLILSVFALMVVCSVNAQQVSKEVALQKAQAFLNKDSNRHPSARKAPRQVTNLVLANDCDEFYIFNDEANGGFVIVSGDERMPAVLGYSYDGHFDANNIPCNMQALLDGYANKAKYVRTHPTIKKEEREIEDWESDIISPLLSTTWGQDEPYKNQCPTIKGEHCVTGCGATAMAQVLAYYKWPQQTTKTIPQYRTETKKILVSAIEPTAIDWENMRQSYPGIYVQEGNKMVFHGNFSEAEGDAVALLMKLCGASIEMDYTLQASSLRSDIAWALVEYFGYSEDARNVFPEKDSDLFAFEHILYNELVHDRPIVYYAFSYDMGHVMVIDGFQGDDDGNHYFHINYGWNSNDYFGDGGYYLLPEAPLYYKDPHAVIGIKPLKPDYPKAYGVLDEGQITLYFDNQQEARNSTVIPVKKLSGNQEITRCVIDPSFKDYDPVALDTMFLNCSNLKEIVGLENLNTAFVSSMEGMFYGCSSLERLDLSSFDTRNVSNMWGLFDGCSSLTSLDLRNFNTRNVVNMGQMFTGCSSLESLDLSNFDTKHVSNAQGMSGMFGGCTSLKSLNLSSFNTDNVENFSMMFNNCSSLTSLDLSSFNTENAYAASGLYGMFRGCSSLKSLDLSGFKTNNVTNMGLMFYGCDSLSTIYVGDGWNTEKVKDGNDMFRYCINLVGGAGTEYCWDYSGIDYAHVDGGPENPGYLTYKESTGVQKYIADEGVSPAVYSLSGIKVRAEGKGTDGLHAGVYIVGGKKVVVK